MHVCDTLVRAPHHQFAVQYPGRLERFGDDGEAAGNVIAGAAVETSLAAGMDELDADPVPLPLGRIVVERYPCFLERVGEHERPEHRHVTRGWLAGTPLGPVEQLGERRLEAVPDLL